ncbi:MAG: acylneuraminate cytidylyltransferase family protein [Deltaproteobacteria bacterium]|nr:acylneuraminate cytidylyltransferase family protein [Deltaproteobacteria bacterium]
MNIVSFIPARGASKGVPGKNKKILGNKPLVAWTVEDALESELIDRVVVSTEDEEISRIARKWGAEVIPRPKELATDTADLQDAVEFTLNRLRENGYDPDYMVAMFPTSPFRRRGLVDSAIRMALDNPDICYVHSLKRVDFDLEDLVDSDGTPYMSHEVARDLKGCVFSTKMNFGVERMREGPAGRRGIILLPDESIDIDLPRDWEAAERACARWL